jgi:PAS domain S-box-containing protein
LEKSQVFDALVDPVLVLNRHRTILYLNPAFEQLYGWSQQELQGEPESRVRLEGKSSLGLQQCWHRRKDGVVFLVELSESSGWWGGRPCFIQIIRDHSASQILETALKNSARYLKLVIQTMDSVMLMLSPSGKILEFNQQAERLHGRSRFEVMDKDYLELFIPLEHRARILEDMQRVIAGAATRGFENPVQSATQGIRILSWNVIRVLSENEEVLGILAIGRDVTEERRAMQVLAEREARLRWVAGSIPGAVYVFTEEQGRPKVLYASEGVTELLEISPEALVEDFKRLSRKIVKEDLPLFIRTMEEAEAADGPWSAEFRIQLKSGELRWIRGQSRPDWAGTKRVWVGFLCDVTWQQQQAQIQEAQNKAVVAGALAMGIAHEMSNPLAYVRANLEVALERPEEQGIREALVEALEGAKRVELLLADLRALASSIKK